MNQITFSIKYSALYLVDKIHRYGDLIVSETSLMEDYNIFLKYEDRGYTVVPMLDIDNLRIWAVANNIDFFEIPSERAYRFKPSRGSQETSQSNTSILMAELLRTNIGHPY